LLISRYIEAGFSAMVTTVENGECANKRFDGTPPPCGTLTPLDLLAFTSVALPG